jgi:hypothetical protein
MGKGGGWSDQWERDGGVTNWEGVMVLALGKGLWSGQLGRGDGLTKGERVMV